MNDLKTLIKVVLFLTAMFLGIKLIFFILGYFNLILGTVFKHLADNWYIYLSVIFLFFLVLSFSAIILNAFKQKKISTIKHLRIELTELFQGILKTIIGLLLTVFILALFFIVLGYLAKFIFAFFDRL